VQERHSSGLIVPSFCIAWHDFARLPTLKVHPAKTPSTTTVPQKIITTMADESKKRAAPAGGAEKSNKKSKVNLCVSYFDRFQD